jgi:tyrosyl-tRNA synthetase
MGTYYELLLEEPLDRSRPAVESKRELARRIVARFHGPEAAEAAERRFDRLHVEREAPDDVPEASLPEGEVVHLPEVISSTFGISRSEARRLLSQGGVRLAGEALDGDALDLPARRLEGEVLQVGKRRFARLLPASGSGPAGTLGRASAGRAR